MDGLEFLAMLDERLGDSKSYPTLNDYSRALDIVRKLKQEEAEAAKVEVEAQERRDRLRCELEGMTNAPPVVNDVPRMRYVVQSKIGSKWTKVGESNSFDAAITWARREEIQQITH